LGPKNALIAVLLLAGVLTTGAQAMTIETRGNTVYATGPLGDDYVEFKRAFSQPGVERVVFINSPGGDLWTAMHVGHLIRERGLATVAAGYCASGCAVMFMGGKERAFSDAFKPETTFIGLHGPANRDTGVVNTSQGVQIYHFIKESMGARFNSDVMKMALYEMDDANAMLRVFDAGRSPKRATFHCRSGKVSRENCKVLDGETALSLGIVTTDAYVSITPPDSFPAPDNLQRTPPAPNVAGMELRNRIEKPEELLRALGGQQCTRSTRCREQIMGFSGLKRHRGLAIPATGRPDGSGWANGFSSETEAFVRAVFYCNTVEDGPTRLCETVLVDDYHVQEFYRRSERSHADALERLSVPTQKYYGGEDSDSFQKDADAPHTDRLDAIAPENLAGIKTFGTQELAAAIKGDQKPVLIDVANLDRALPGALSLFNGGLAHDDFLVDTVYESRFLELLKLLSSNKKAPIVFYSKGRDWYGANAALRAVRVGYKQVGWYRGGLESWNAAQLPVALAAIRAVVE